MNHWIIVPVVLPAALAAIIVLTLRHHVSLQRVFSLSGTLMLLGVATGLTLVAATGAIEVYELGNWPAPFGIVLVLDRLSALMVLLTAFLATPVLLYAIWSGWDRRGHHFHALFQFQLMGICGAFLTGDAFNLFVFFEILLIASYGLMIHGGGRRRLRAGVQYVVYNLLGSTLFLFALGTIYAVTGTLNMADLSIRVAEIPETDTALLRVGAVLLLMVFAIKAALLPLHFWLPETYAAAPAPVAALFAVMTKVGAYAILRIYTLVFGPELGATGVIVSELIIGAALITLAIGAIGILGTDRLGRQAAFAAIGSMGTMLIALSVFTPETTTAALYYMIHSTLTGALLFLTVDLVRERRPQRRDIVTPGALTASHGIIAALFFGAAIAAAGMPPLSGFIGKLLILDAVRETPEAWLIWAVILVTSLVTLVGFARSGSTVFWKPSPVKEEVEPDREPKEGPPAPPPAPPGPLPIVAAFGLFFAIAALTVFAGWINPYLAATAEQLYTPDGYITAVIGRGEIR